MPALLEERPKVWSLWTSDGSAWSMLDSSPDRNALERQAKSLKAVFISKSFMVVQGLQGPGRL
jgi:hypothetical protein